MIERLMYRLGWVRFGRVVDAVEEIDSKQIEAAGNDWDVRVMGPTTWGVLTLLDKAIYPKVRRCSAS